MFSCSGGIFIDLGNISSRYDLPDCMTSIKSKLAIFDMKDAELRRNVTIARNVYLSLFLLQPSNP
jgi:hypothetical protein